MRTSDLNRLYQLLKQQEEHLGGKRLLKDCNGRMKWPRRGVYFFFEPGENRADGESPRVVRVGTHALAAGSRTTLWTRISQHRGTNAGGGNHRASIFRKLVGAAVITSGLHLDAAKYWGVGATRPAGMTAADRTIENALEQEVSRRLGGTSVLWLEINDESGPESRRGFIERNAIALLSNINKAEPLDPPSGNWLGLQSQCLVRQSGLWNNNHVKESYDSDFPETMEDIVTNQS